MTRIRLGRLRIISGSLRGRRIRVPPGRDVRPTGDRVREALFSILGPEVDGARVLDAYAGSGALGFEALSRGARRVTFMESAATALACIRDNAVTLGVEDRCEILAGQVESLLQTGSPIRRYDLVMADPPYGVPTGGDFLARLVDAGALSAGARVVFQRSRGAEPADTESTGLRLVRTARYGRTCLDFYAFRAGPQDHPREPCFP